jgi:hypothetical protein
MARASTPVNLCERCDPSILVYEDAVRLVAPALQELAGKKEAGVLPALQNIFLRTSGCQPSGSVKEEIEQFITIRQLHGHPVTVHYEGQIP